MSGRGWGRRESGSDHDRIRRDLDEEIEAHIEMRTDELIARGMTPAEARVEAERRFGDVEAARRSAASSAARLARRARRTEAVDSLRRWFAHAVRSARSSPGPTLLTAGIFALAVGLSTATFSLVDHVLLRSLPFPAPDRLVALQGMGEKGNPISRVSMGDWVDWKNGATTLASTGLASSQDVTVLTDDGAYWASGALVLGPLFETLGVPVQAGRPLTEQDGQALAPVVAISRRLWMRVFGGNPDLASLSLAVNGRRVEVVGVVAAGREFPGGTDVWIPVPYHAESGGMRNNINYEAVARLEPGVSPDRAAQELGAIARGIRERDPEAIYSYGVGVLPLRDVVVGDSRSWLQLLIGAVFFVLAVACANLAGLGLADARRRSGDTSVRMALGASRGQVLGEQLARHLLPALLGGGLGVLLAALGSRTVLAVFADHLPRTTEVAFDGRIAAFGLAASLLAGLVSGFLPSLRAATGIAHGLGSDPRGGVRGGRGLPGAVMVGTEVAIAVTLLIGGGLLLRSLVSVMSRDLGFDPDGVVVLDIALAAPEYRDLDARMAYWNTLLERIDTEPAVVESGLGNWIPTGGGGKSFVDIEGVDAPNDGAGYRVVSDDYFGVMGIPVLTGRSFEKTDTHGSERVGLVNHAAAERFWPGQNPVGRHIRAPSMEAYYNGGTADWITVVGVVGDVRHYGFDTDPEAELFVLHRQMPAWTGYMSVVVKLRPGAPAGVLDSLTRTVRSLDTRLAVQSGTLVDRVRALLAERRLVLGVLGLFAGASLLLVCLGVYGLVSFAVAARTREIAVRAALGAARGGILALVLGSALRVVLAGSVVGLVAAFLLRGALSAMVVGVGTSDPLTYFGSAGVMIAVAVVAAFLPSLRAARLDPVEALRRE